MGDAFRISAKKLGGLAMSNFCQRCFWLRNHMKGEPPFGVFPRLFNDIDGYVKKLVGGWIVERSKAPAWLSGLGQIVASLPTPKSAVFQMPIGEHVTLSGEADAIFRLKDDTLCIADYKTAYERGFDDPLYSIYVVQLNAYALLAEHHGLGTVSKLALVYTEAMTGDVSAR